MRYLYVLNIIVVLMVMLIRVVMTLEQIRVEMLLPSKLQREMIVMIMYFSSIIVMSIFNNES